ncbi:MAG: DNA-directed DNA polymerase I [Candidatus Bathyarchaeota archaeon]|nr:MAG: DNA-directed DNA polymerase I [Candidatus Bathyarchaeota archaeon]
MQIVSSMQSLDEQKLQEEDVKDSKRELMDSLIQRLGEIRYEPEEIASFKEAILVGARYDGEKMVAALKFYDPEKEEIYLWRDHTGHLPYCFTRLSPDELRLNSNVIEHKGFEELESVTKFNALKDEKEEYTKIIAKDPLSIGGKSNSIREYLEETWESRIRYHESYLYDAQLIPGLPYSLEKGEHRKIIEEFSAEAQKRIEGLFNDETEEMQEYALEWTELLQQQIPNYRRASLDIEVYSPIVNRVPDPQEAPYPVICVSIVDTEGEKRVLLLRREGIERGDESILGELIPEYYDTEEELIFETLRALSDYPFILTFNGDQFDLKYLFNRAIRLGFPREKIPLTIGRDSVTLTYGLHIDLYRFFFNRSIQVYAFSQKYRELTLDAVSEALLNLGKIPIEKPFSELNYTELADYCLRDSELTLSLSSMSNNLLMRLITLIARIARIPFEDVVREGVSRWIRSLMYYEHRRRGWIIPRSEDLSEYKGVTATEAIIKGKKYKGAIVIEPTPGVHFGVYVLDFASLYPSIIKQYNLSYETILCPHTECRQNKIPGTPHWVCTRHRGLSSLVIGSLRDLRVKWYKKRARDKKLSSEQREFFNVVQLTLKVFLNASYGVFGAEHFPFYCPSVAESTAALGRYAINETTKQAEKLGIKVIYGDTDSIFLDKPTEDQIENLLEWSKDQLGMELEVDKQYRYAAFSTRKKNYFGVFPDGSVDIKGLTGKKRNTPVFLKKAFYDVIDVLSEVENQGDFKRAKEKVKNVVHECYTTLKKREFSLEDLSINIMLGKPLKAYVKTTPQHVKAALLLAEDGQEVKPGDIISFVKTNDGLGVKPVKLARAQDVDVEKYTDYVKSTFEQIFDTLDIEFGEITGITKLEDFLL